MCVWGGCFVRYVVCGRVWHLNHGGFMMTRETDQRPCVTCGGSDDEGLILLCDACNLPMHADCVGFEGTVLGDWLCPVCEVEDDRQRTPSKCGVCEP